MIFNFQSSVASLFMCVFVQLSSPQEGNVQVLHKPIGSTATVVCTGCGNNSHCIVNVNNVTLDENYYVISNNGSITVSVEDVQAYGIMHCGGSTEQLMSYQICPPRNGNAKYSDWLTILSSTNMTTVGQSVKVMGTFLHLPHSGITIEVNGSVSGDEDLSCTANNHVRDKSVNYTCIAKQPGVKEVKMQLTFCDIDFDSLLLITIEDILPAPVNQSTSTSMTDGASSRVMMSSNMTTSSNVSSSSDSVFSQSIDTTASSSSSPSSFSTSMPTNSMEDDGSLSGGAVAAIVVSMVLLSIVMIIAIGICIYMQWFRSTGNTPSVNNITFQQNNVHNNVQINGVPTSNGNVHSGDNRNSAASNGPAKNDGTDVNNVPIDNNKNPIQVVEDGGDDEESLSDVHVPRPETRNHAEQGIGITDSMEQSSSGQTNVQHDEVETTEFKEPSSSGQSQQRALLAPLHQNQLGLPYSNIATVYK